MCGRYTLTKNIPEVADRFGVREPSLFENIHRYNIAPTQTVPVVLWHDNRSVLDAFRWGLVPFWAKDDAIGSKMINARRETVAEKPAFKYAFAKRRCLIPADGFYEWATRADRTKQPYRFRRKDDALFAFAGLWESWTDKTTVGNSPLYTCTIITTDANGVVGTVHDRMPVILHPDDEKRWLDPSAETQDLTALLQPYPDDLMERYAVSQRVNLPTNDDADLIEAIVL